MSPTTNPLRQRGGLIELAIPQLAGNAPHRVLWLDYLHLYQPNQLSLCQWLMPATKKRSLSWKEQEPSRMEWSNLEGTLHGLSSTLQGKQLSPDLCLCWTNHFGIIWKHLHLNSVSDGLPIFTLISVTRGRSPAVNLQEL